MRRFILISVIALLATAPVAKGQNSARFSDIKAGMRDYRLEHIALVEANKRASALRCRETYFKAIITSDHWAIEKNQEGRTIGRHIHMELYGESYDGHCGATHFVFRQAVLGDDTYSRRIRVADIGDFYDLPCEY